MPRLSHIVRWAVLPIQLLSIFAVVFLCCPITADGAEWVNPLSGVWDDPGNWSGGEVPNGSDAEVVLGPVISGPTTVTVDSSVDLNALLLGSPDHTYTIAGSGQLSFIGPASIDVVSGTHTIAVPILGNQQVTKRGEGTLRLEGDHEIQGVLRLEGGKLESQVGSLSVDQLVTLEGELTLGPGNAVWSSEKAIVIADQGQGTLTIAGGSRLEQLLPNEISVVGYGPDSVGEVLVTGSNSAWILKGIIVVGINGTGRIRVEEGARFESGRHVVGSVLGEYNDAEIVVTGEGSRWTSLADVYFGYQGATRLLIEAGGHVEFTFPFAPFPARATAYFHGPENHITVSGEGSLWSIDGDVSTPYDTGSLTIEVNQGGAIESWQTFIGPSGKVSLTDPGSRWDVLDAFVMKGGELTLKNGATMTAAEFSLGQSQNPTSRPGGDVRVLVTGAGTKLTADYGVSLGRLSLSSSNVDQLTLSDGAQIVALGIGVLRTGLLTGHGGTIVGHVTNSGIIAPGNSPGALTIDGNFTQFSDGHLAFEIAGPESYDQLVVTGHASLAGTMSIELLDGYVPALGTTFQLFDFGSAEGSLALEFPRLGGGLGWDTRQLISDGIIRVAPMSAIPEPQGLAMVALALVAVAGRLRKGRFVFGLVPRVLVMLTFAAGTAHVALGETITYSFSGVVDELVDAPATGVPAWAVVGSPVRGILRWETGLEDTDPDPNVGSFFSPEGAVVIDFSGERYFHTFNRTQAVPDAPQGIYVGVNKEVIPLAPSDVFSLSRSWTMLLLDVPGITEEIPDSLPQGGNHRFLVQDYYFTPHDNVLTPYYIGGSLISLKRIEETPVWTAGGSGSWEDPANWENSLVPNEIGISASFGPHITGPTTVTVASEVELTDLMLDSPEHSYTFAGPGPLTFFAPASIDVVSGSHTIAAPLAGSLEFTKRGAGTLRLEGSHEILGGVRQERGEIELLDATLRTSRLLTLNGDVLIGRGGELRSGSGHIALEEGTTSTVVVDGGQWIPLTSRGDRFAVGYRGDGRLTIKNGGLVKSGYSWVGGIPGSRGEVVVTGEDSIWESNEMINVGGSLSGQVYDRNGNPIGDPKTPSVGMLTIDQGGKVTSTYGSVDPTGVVLVRGAESSWTMSSSLGVRGTMTVEGATIRNTAPWGFNESGVSGGGQLTLKDNAAWITGGGIVMGYQGTGKLTIASGSRLEQLDWGARNVIGQGRDSDIEMLVTGERSTAIFNGVLTVGRQGAGRIRVEEGGTFEVKSDHPWGIIFGDYQSLGEIVVTGAGSSWSTVGDVYIGEEGTGRLLIEDGARVIHKARGIPGSRLPITVYVRGVNSEATVLGAGSLWKIEENLHMEAFSGEVNVTVAQGGALESWNGTIDRGSHLTLSDQGSRWNLVDAIGVSGGELTVTHGAALHSARAALGTRISTYWTSDYNAEILVTGAGTTWTSTTLVQLGSPLAPWHQRDRLTVSDQAVLTTPLLEIRPTGLLTGHDGTVIGDVVSSGTIAPGNSPGLLTIEGDLSQSAGGRLAFEIAGPEAYDQLVVTGHASLAGTMSIELLDGYVPALGTTFQLFDFGSADGELALEFPRLGGGLGWDTRQLISDGVISVAPMSAIPEPPSLAAIALAAFLFAATVHHKLKICNLHFAITWDR